MADMPSFTAADGAEPAYHVTGAGEPLLCLLGTGEAATRGEASA